MTAESRISSADAERWKEAVRKATAEDASRLARTLARAFYENAGPPVDPAGRLARRVRQLERSLDYVFLKRLCLLHDETYTTASIAGEALWLLDSLCKQAGEEPAQTTRRNA